MPGTFWSEAGATAAALGLVAAVALPVGAACGWAARRAGEPLAPRWRPWGGGWTGVEAVLVFVAAFLARSSGAAVGLLLVPVFVAGFGLWRREAGAERADPPRRTAADIALGVWVWLWLTPATFAVHFLATAVAVGVGVEPDKHPLTRVPLTTTSDVLTFFIGACVVGPFFEEMGFRRVLLPWAARRRGRPWLVMAAAGGGAVVAVSLTEGKSPADLRAPLMFLGALAGGLFLVTKARAVRPRFPVRTAAAVYATAAFFALMHAGVWPTPVPLFVLGLGLGWLVARTGAVTAAVVTHGLFNAVSAVLLLRGSA